MSLKVSPPLTPQETKIHPVQTAPIQAVYAQTASSMSASSASSDGCVSSLFKSISDCLFSIWNWIKGFFCIQTNSQEGVQNVGVSRSTVSASNEPNQASPVEGLSEEVKDVIFETTNQQPLPLSTDSEGNGVVSENKAVQIEENETKDLPDDETDSGGVEIEAERAGTEAERKRWEAGQTEIIKNRVYECRLHSDKKYIYSAQCLIEKSEGLEEKDRFFQNLINEMIENEKFNQLKKMSESLQIAQQEDDFATWKLPEKLNALAAEISDLNKLIKFIAVIVEYNKGQIDAPDERRTFYAYRKIDEKIKEVCLFCSLDVSVRNTLKNTMQSSSEAGEEIVRAMIKLERTVKVLQEQIAHPALAERDQNQLIRQFLEDSHWEAAGGYQKVGHSETDITLQSALPPAPQLDGKRLHRPDVSLNEPNQTSRVEGPTAESLQETGQKSPQASLLEKEKGDISQTTDQATAPIEDNEAENNVGQVEEEEIEEDETDSEDAEIETETEKKEREAEENARIKLKIDAVDYETYPGVAYGQQRIHTSRDSEEKKRFFNEMIDGLMKNAKYSLLQKMSESLQTARAGGTLAAWNLPEDSESLKKEIIELYKLIEFIAIIVEYNKGNIDVPDKRHTFYAYDKMDEKVNEVYLFYSLSKDEKKQFTGRWRSPEGKAMVAAAANLQRAIYALKNQIANPALAERGQNQLIQPLLNRPGMGIQFMD